MRRMKNLLLVGVLLLCHLSLSARIIASGSCGANLTWTLADDGLLRISGSGDMNDFIIHHNDFSPWNGFEDYVKAIYIDSNVTSIGNYAFCGFDITSVTIPESVKSIGWGAFSDCCNLETITIPTEVVEIAPQTFRGCSSLSSIIVSQNLKLVGDDALEGTAWYNSQSDGLVYFNNILYEWKGEMPENTHIVVREGTVAIAEAAFKGCVNLNSITIPECVTFIGGDAFRGTMWYDNQPDGLIYINNVLYEYKGIMPQLMDIELKEGIVGISEYAFEDCENLASVTIPESVTMIGSQAFADCSSLRSIIIPKNVEHIGVNAFIRCSGLTTIEVAEGNSTYDSRDGCNAIIKTSGNTLLRGCTSTKIPNSVNYISFCALESCGFESIEIPEGVASIGCQAFYGCANLTSVILPEGLISIGASAFHSCINLASIAFPESLNDIKPRALGGTAWYGKQSDGLVYINNILYGYKGTMPEKSSIAIKEGTVGICIDAFAEYKNLVSIVVPESVTSIGGNAFSGCSSLTAINIPKGVTGIGWGTFSGCSGLTTITCEATTPPAIANYAAFGGVDKSIPVYVPAGSVDAYKVAEYWSGFTNIQPILNIIASGTCGDNLTWKLFDGGKLVIEGTGNMYDYSYGGAPWYEYRESIQAITIPESVTNIGESAFEDCNSLTSIIIPESVTSIGNRAFQFCSSLIAITISEGVTSIGELAFSSCESLISIVVEDGNIVYDSRNNCNAIIEKNSNTLIQGCSTTIIPESVTSIGFGAFKGCSNLTAITIPEALTSIGNNAFEDCSSLSAIIIPEGVTLIATNIFNGCSSLTAITIPKSVRSIGGKAFCVCSSLAAITIPESVTSIREMAFFGCSSLTAITSRTATPPTIGSYTFSEVDKSIPVYVPAGSVEAYKAAEGWSEFTNIQPLSNEYALTVSSAGYATLYLNYAAEIPDDVKVYIATSVEGDRLMMTRVTGVLPAETGVIVRAEAGEYTFAESDETPANVEGNLLSGTATDTYIAAESGYKYYVLAQKNDLVGMYRPKLTDGRFLNNANKAYLALESSNLGIFDDETNTEDEGGQLSNRLRFDFGGTTGIDNSQFTIHN